MVLKKRLPVLFTILWGDTRQVSKRGNGVKETKQNGFLAYQSKLDSEFNMNKPVMTQLNKFYIIGYEYQTNLQSEEYFTDIPLFYMDFGKRSIINRFQREKHLIWLMVYLLFMMMAVFRLW